MLSVIAATLLLPKAFFVTPILLGAHRGGAEEVPENTALGFRTLGEKYPSMLLEADIRLTKDGIPVLLHDETVDRTTDGHGPLDGLTLAATQRLDAGFRFSPDGINFPYRGKGVRIPTLEEALRASPQSRFELEFKSTRTFEASVPIVRRLHAESRVMVVSFIPSVMDRARELLPEATLGYDPRRASNLLRALRSDRWDAYEPEADVLSLMEESAAQVRLTSEEVQLIRAKGIRFQIHTPNSQAAIQKWLAVGVDSILTDRPTLLADLAMSGPMVTAHSHNDYEHRRPLADAMDQGFASMEADIYLQGGELRVAHDKKDTQPGRTLEKLYLDPMDQAFRRNGRVSGGIYPWKQSVQLLVDIKEDGENVYRELERRLKRYRPMLTRLENGKLIPGAVTIVLSGSRPTESLPRAKTRLSFLDGRGDDPVALKTPEISPLTSDSFYPTFTWTGSGPMKADEEVKLRELIDQAHRRGQKVRFWGIPDTTAAWELTLATGMDYVNTDRIPALAEYLRKRYSVKN